MIVMKRVRKDDHTHKVVQKVTYTYYLFSVIPIYRFIDEQHYSK
jgi:hypothetical protein